MWSTRHCGRVLCNLRLGNSGRLLPNRKRRQFRKLPLCLHLQWEA